MKESIFAKLLFQNYLPFNRSKFNFIFSFLRISRSHLTKLGKIMRRSCKWLFVLCFFHNHECLKKKSTGGRTEPLTSIFWANNCWVWPYEAWEGGYTDPSEVAPPLLWCLGWGALSPPSTSALVAGDSNCQAGDVRLLQLFFHHVSINHLHSSTA